MSETHLLALEKAGWKDEKIDELRAVYRIYRTAHAFIQLPEAIPGEHIFLLAEWANAIFEHRVSPYLVAGIHPNEVDRGVLIGKCSFYGNGRMMVREGLDAEKKTKFAKEKEAFGEIITDIKKKSAMEDASANVSCRVMSWRGTRLFSDTTDGVALLQGQCP